ncbi:MAG: MFS family permease [Gammaproteobacteria bacterium]|jgi:MFS family permease
MASKIYRWLDVNVFSLGNELRWSYLPPLMVYMAAGISGLTGIVGTFFVKEYLGLSAAFLASLGFWANIPWALKMPLGHLVDLIWRWKSVLVYIGAGVIAISLLIMIGLLTNRDAMVAIMPAGTWFVTSVILGPIGYVIQDTVADAMTVEAVPSHDEAGEPIDADRLKLMHTTMQTLGRVAIIGGSVLVAGVNLYLFRDIQQLADIEKAQVYRDIYRMALVIPLISIAGVMLASFIKKNDTHRQQINTSDLPQIDQLVEGYSDPTKPNWWILGGSLAFVIFTLYMGLNDFRFSQEIIFLGSFAIVTFLIIKLTRELQPDARLTLVGTAIVIFVFRAIPTQGPGLTWWMIDQLKFDQYFFSILSLIGSVLTLAGMFIFRRFMAQRSIAYIVGALTIAGTILTLPFLGMFFGMHEWTAKLTAGIVDARFIALVNTALESPLGQIAMIPMLAWIANSAPDHLKATFFAVMASFTNLALSLSQLGTKYLNQIYTVTREVRDVSSNEVLIAADYSDLGELIIASLLVGLLLPFAAILIVRMSRLKWA